jgi:hypothetical protein
MTLECSDLDNKCTVDAQGSGRVMKVQDAASVYLVGLVIRGGDALNAGGIKIDGSTVVMTRCTITENTGTDHGGGLYVASSVLRMTYCEISFNGEPSYGGGVHVGNWNTVTMIQCTFRSNSAGDTYSRGGGLFIGQSDVDVISCEFVDNNSEKYSGGIHMAGSSSRTLNIYSTIFSGNTAGTSGPDITTFEGTTTIYSTCPAE